ncbi:hypothetical protein DH2020_023682 [Rehmannia glutinosa]|uniref:Reverse transcriptase domain-containing protein n=1 Tax=Rehmannia glutinosa TaxID=99300 RepID=A0ABR0W8G8_REHGL
MHPAGRILVLWNPTPTDLQELDISSQVIHCAITCKVSSISLLASFIYAYHTVGSRKLFTEVRDFAVLCSHESKDFTCTNNEVWCKLDRVMVNKNWFDQDLDGMANFLPSGCLSDHSPCIVSLLDVVTNTNRPFQFFNMWASHTDFNDLVATHWDLYIRGTKQFIFSKKLKHLKRPLTELNNKNFSHISSRVAKAKEDLELAQLQLHDDPTNVNLQNFVATMRKQSMSLSESERSFYYQQAKCKHLSQSDRGTKFFHDLVKRNKKHNQIVAVYKDDGLSTTSQEEVSKEFAKFYDDCLAQLTHANRLILTFLISIACCNVLYKVITKIIASRMAPLMENIVDPAQEAFVGGRLMTENIHLAQELLR